MFVLSAFVFACVCAFFSYLDLVTSGDPVNLTVTVTRKANYPIDLYYLMDLSNSMKDDLLKLKTLAQRLCTVVC